MRISDWSSDVCSSDLESRHNLIYWRYQDYLGALMGARGRNPLSIGVIIRRRTGRLNHRRFPQFSRRLRRASLHSANEKIGSPVARFAAASRWLTRTARHRARLHLSRSEEHTSELQSLMRISYAVFCLKKKN